MAYAPPNPKRLAWEIRQDELREQRQTEIAACYQQYLTPQERAAREARRLERGLPVIRRGRR